MDAKKSRTLLIGSNLWYLGEGLFGPLFAVFAGRIGGDILEITWAWSIYLIVTGIVIVIVGRISDKIGKEKLMLCGYALNAIFTFGYLFVSSPVHLFIVEAGLGIALALATPTWDALYEKYDDKKRSGQIWGLAEGQREIITGVSIIIGGFIVSFFSFTILFVMMGSIQVFATGYIIQILKSKEFPI